MATTTPVRRQIEAGLREIAAEVDFLPTLAGGWDEESAANRDVWHLEWRELMARLEGLDHAYRASQMTPDQQARYQELLCQLKAALPLIERLGLYPPPVPLEA
jgi:hypothetical protein